jgi:alpha-L-fucosidase
MQQRLIEMGDWLKVNGEAIYGTRHAGRDCQWSEGARPGQEFGEFRVKYNLMEQIGPKAKGGKAVKQFFFTKKPGAVYAITTGWLTPQVTIRKVKIAPDTKVTLLGVPGNLQYKMSGEDLLIDVPALNPEQLPCLHAYTVKISGAELLPE